MWCSGNVTRCKVARDSVVKQSVTAVVKWVCGGMYVNLNSVGIQFVKRMVSAVLSRCYFRQENVAYVWNVFAPALRR